MPILARDELQRLRKELNSRIDVLLRVIEGKGLLFRCINKDNMRATVGNASEVRMAVDNFKSILSEIRRLK